MKKLLLILFIYLLLFTTTSFAYWIWTPQTGRWINPKYSAKESPQQQLAFALEMFNSKEYAKAKDEFAKLIRYYPLSKEAAEAQYYIGACLEHLNKPFEAFLAYQKVIEKYPFSERQDEIVERQYFIGEKFFNEPQSKTWEFIVGSNYNVVEIFREVIENAPYGKYAPLAQYRIGLFLKSVNMYPEARKEFEKLVNDYPQSEWVKAAKYQIALCDAKSSLRPDYDQAATKEAVKGFEDFVKDYPEAELTIKAQKQIDSLKDKEAENNFKIGQFYERQKAYDSAKIYYGYVVNDFQDTQWATRALERLSILERR